MGAENSSLKVVLDTNTVISAILFPHGRLAWLTLAWKRGDVTPLLSAATTRELLQALAYAKFRLDGDDILAALAAYLPFTEVVDIDGTRRGSLPVCRDRHDQMFLELALAAEAEVLVTGDNALLALDGRVPFAIESPAVFRERFEADKG